jgi:MFS family permease
MVLAVLVFQATWVQGFWAIVILGFVTSAAASLTGPNVKMMLMNVNVPENRGAIFSIFNLTDSLGNGIGRFVGGWLAQIVTIGPAMTISSIFWLPCGILLIVLVRFFVPDVENLRHDMKALATEIGGKSRAV